jgi:hypothetical protein
MHKPKATADKHRNAICRATAIDGRVRDASNDAAGTSEVTTGAAAVEIATTAAPSKAAASPAVGINPSEFRSA